MRLLSLSLEHYRNFDRHAVEFSDDDLHLFVGPNGSGKTNLLEAIALVSLTHSFLGTEEEDLRRWGTEFYRVRARVQSDAGESEELEVVSQLSPRRRKAAFRNGVALPLSMLVGRLPVVTFLPQDLSLFTGAPSDRRRFLDQILCQVSPEYAQALLTYQKALRQRNALLKSIAEGSADPQFLAPWDQELAQEGSLLTLLRLELIEAFTLSIRSELTALGESWNEVTVRLERSGTAARGREELTRELLEALGRSVQRDIILRSTTVGPHRDDWTVAVDGRPLQTFASRGQQRIAVLALLLLQASYLEVRRGEKPVVLLDDIFSELDHDHRGKLLGAFGGHQIIMTATEMPVGAECFRGSVQRVGEGYTAAHA